MSTEGSYLNIIKDMYYKFTVNIILNGEKMKAFPLRLGTSQEMSIIATFIQHTFESPNQSNQRRKGNKRNPNWKVKSKTVTFCIENPKDATRKLLELINEFGKVIDIKLIYINWLHFNTLTANYQKEK